MDYDLKDITGLEPLAGDTNQSYVGYLNGQRVFVKKNSTPFFVAVANEKLAPQFLWSKTIDGHFWIAQEWLEGRVLKSFEIAKFPSQAMGILKHLHRSDYLALMLYRLEGQEMEPIDFLQEYYWQLPDELEREPLLKHIYTKLEDELPNFDHFNICACHGDVNHKNWIFRDQKQDEIYLIDWDSAILSDIFSDIGPLLYRYVDVWEWENWLKAYGLPKTDENWHKIWWYGQMQQLMQIKRQYEKGRLRLVKQEIAHLQMMTERKEQEDAR